MPITEGVNVSGFIRIPAGRRGALALAAAFAVAWAGCMSVQSRTAMAEPVARVAVANLTDDTWEIAVQSAAQVAVRTERLMPRTVAQLNLSAGDYVIEQKLVTDGSPAGGQRRFAARFAAGQDYTWSLAALRTSGADASERTQL